MRVSFFVPPCKNISIKKFLCQFSGTLLFYSSFLYIIKICENIYISLREDSYEIKFY